MLDLVLYLFIYSFAGWCIEVAVIALAEHRFANRGVLNLPLCLSYGIIMVLLIIMTRERTNHGFIMFGICLVVISATEFLAGYLAKRLFHRQLWDYMNLSLFGGQWENLVVSLLLSFCFFTFLKIIHPFVFALIHLIPRALRHSISIGLMIVLVLDLITVIPAFLETKNRIGTFIYSRIRKRLDRAYPGSVPLQETDGPAEAEESGRKGVFASGICFDKLVWVFMLFGIAGNLIETLVVRYQTGIWMRRASLLFTPVSIVWGFGGVLFMIMLSHMALREDRYVFVGGFLLGGAFEYMCSVITETFLGTKFWDYSGMPFNFNGRTNLLFCFLWGFVAMLWLKVVYPKVSGQIEKIPVVIGKAVTIV
ncbi:MAG: putative ABC transporter permease, partial [Lachnospiraceae bacterium]|nr:putative ABC transporter permease [Lachnospiraceae bacterium]